MINKQPQLLFQCQKQFAQSIPINTGIVSKAVSSRAGLYKMAFLLGSIHMLSTYLSTAFIKKALNLSVQDYLINKKVTDQSNFQIFGIIEVGSIKLTRGSNDVRFRITDFKDTIDVLYNGFNKFEFKDGTSIVLTSYCPDPSNKKSIIAIDYMTKHSMESQNWQDKLNSSRSNYGLNAPNDSRIYAK